MRRFLLAGLFMALAACVPHKQWRTKPYYTAPSDPAAKTEERFVIPQDLDSARWYSLAFVEFKNDGSLWDQRQLAEALRAIDDADQRSDHHALVITFIHGWKNNARQENNNVLDFRQQLNRIAAKACRDPKRCGVVGIYLAWSGDLIKRDFNTLRGLTYFNRRNTAIQVATPPATQADLAPIGEALFTIMKRARTPEERERNHSVVVGHSFGGLILEYAISKRMREIGEELRKELGTHATADEFRLKALDDFANLVVLINQAAPAVNAVTLLCEYRSYLEKVNLLRPPMRSGCAKDDPSQECKPLTRPLILSVSSETDLATRTILPIAETVSPPKNRPALPPEMISKLPDGLNGKDANKVFTTAAAHTPQLYSHELRECKNGDCSPCLKDDKANIDKFYIPVSITLPAYAPGNLTKTKENRKYCLVRNYTPPAKHGCAPGDASPDCKWHRAWNSTPYWIFHIPPEVVPDHGTIFTDRFTDFLESFLPPWEHFLPSNQTRAPMQRLLIAEPKRQ